MKIEILNSYEVLSLKAKNIILNEIERKKNLLLCAPTGHSPKGAYDFLCKDYEKDRALFEHLRILKLDEWGGISMDDPNSCESYIQTHLTEPLHIPKSRYNGFFSNPEDPLQECKRIQDQLEKEGPIDLCILGLGANGHLGLNEPADFLQAHCHQAKLTDNTLENLLASGMQTKPGYGLTLGMADLFYSKMILLLICGKQKRAIVTKLLAGQITSLLPASFLWLHPNVICLIEKDAME